MTKDEFWQTIDSANKEAPFIDQKVHLLRIQQELMNYSKDDLLDWDCIMGEYVHAAFSYDLWAASSFLGAHDSDDGFTDFRSWLISRGKDVYMEALRDPESLVDVVRNGEKLNFESFRYAASYVYDAKLEQNALFAVEPSYIASDYHKLDPSVRSEILKELPEKKALCGPPSTWTSLMLCIRFPRIFDNINRFENPYIIPASSLDKQIQSAASRTANSASGKTKMPEPER